LVAITEGLPVREVTYTITLVSYDADESGGVRLNLFLEDGQVFSIGVGPSPNGPDMEFHICPTDDSDYDECAHPDRDSVLVAVPIQMKAVWTGEAVEFYVDDIRRVTQAVTQKKILKVQLSMYADPGSTYHTTVDDVHIIFADP
jgi:hypothetical protein